MNLELRNKGSGKEYLLENVLWYTPMKHIYKGKYRKIICCVFPSGESKSFLASDYEIVCCTDSSYGGKE